MSLDRQIVRLMAVMIFAIIAYVTPSAVQAHDGHHHGGHDHSAMTREATAQVAPAPAFAPTSRDGVAALAVIAKAPMMLKAAVPVRMATLQADNAGRGCCPGPCKGACCGTMSCCVSGILSAPATMPAPAFGHVVLVTHDVDGRSGLGPEAPPRPPRTLA